MEDFNTKQPHLYLAVKASLPVNANSPEAESYARRSIGFYKKANDLNPDNPDIMLNMGLLYARLNDCDNVPRYLSREADVPGLSDAQRSQARQSLNRCRKLVNY